MKLVISDAHEGLKAACAKVLKATWQRCRVHFTRNVLATVPKGQRRRVSAMIGTIFAQDSGEAGAASACPPWRADQTPTPNVTLTNCYTTRWDTILRNARSRILLPAQRSDTGRWTTATLEKIDGALRPSGAARCILRDSPRWTFIEHHAAFEPCDPGAAK